MKTFQPLSITLFALLFSACAAEVSENADEPGTSSTTSDDVEQSAQALSGGRHGWAWANQPTGNNYAPVVAYNSLGSVRAFRTGTGQYRMEFTNLGNLSSFPLADGNIQVVAKSVNPRRCKVGSSATDATKKLLIDVRCFNNAGTPTDSEYMVFFAANDGSSFGPGAYVWSSTNGTQNPWNSWNSSGGIINVTRSSLGKYLVEFHGLPFHGAFQNVQATAQSGTVNWCSATSSRGVETQIDVSCFSANNTVSDASFFLNFGEKPTSPNAKGGFIQVQSDGHRLSTFNSGGATPTSSNLDQGRSKVRYPGLATTSLLLPHVTAIGSTGEYCQIESSYAVSGTTDYEVITRCYSGSGSLKWVPYHQHVAYAAEPPT